MDIEKVYENVALQRVRGIEEIKRALSIVEKYIKRRHLVLYGGTAIDLSLKAAKHTGIYSADVIPDYDFLSPTSLEDSWRIAQELHQSGFTQTGVIPAIHPSTRKVRIDKAHPVADVSHFPEPYFSKIPKLRFNGFLLVHPDYQRIDLHRSLAFLYEGAPRENWRNRMAKDIKRLALIDQHCPINRSKKKSGAADFVDLTLPDVDSNDSLNSNSNDSLNTNSNDIPNSNDSSNSNLIDIPNSNDSSNSNSNDIPNSNDSSNLIDTDSIDSSNSTDSLNTDSTDTLITGSAEDYFVHVFDKSNSLSIADARKFVPKDACICGELAYASFVEIVDRQCAAFKIQPPEIMRISRVRSTEYLSNDVKRGNGKHYQRTFDIYPEAEVRLIKGHAVICFDNTGQLIAAQKIGEQFVVNIHYVMASSLFKFFILGHDEDLQIYLSCREIVIWAEKHFANEKFIMKLPFFVNGFFYGKSNFTIALMLQMKARDCLAKGVESNDKPKIIFSPKAEPPKIIEGDFIAYQIDGKSSKNSVKKSFRCN